MSKRNQVFRDPVHSNIEFSRIEPWDILATSLIETPQVQRLRRVRQLGLANLVYHGAEHSRFIHTLGVTHLAKRLYVASTTNSGRSIDEKEIAAVVAAALLHDTGHPPFSHAVEKELGVRHEKVTVHLLRSGTEVTTLLKKYGGEEFVDLVASLIEGSTDAPIVDLISSQLDADRLDYVLRDGYYAGVPNAQFDLERIVQMALRDADGIFFDHRALYAIEGYFTARYHLYLQLYYHKTVRAAEVMLRSLIRRARVIAEKDPGALGPINPALVRLFEVADAAQAALVTDADLWTAFEIWMGHSPDPILSGLSRGLLNRILFRAIDVKVDTVPRFYEEKLPLIQELARSNGFDPAYYVQMDTARDNPYKIADLDPSISVRLQDGNGAFHQIEALSGIIGALQKEAYQKVRCCVPVELRDRALALLN